VILRSNLSTIVWHQQCSQHVGLLITTARGPSLKPNFDISNDFRRPWPIHQGWGESGACVAQVGKATEATIGLEW
jgi:hypothetical protein